MNKILNYGIRYNWPLPPMNGMATISCARRKELRAKRKKKA